MTLAPPNESLRKMRSLRAMVGRRFLVIVGAVLVALGPQPLTKLAFAQRFSPEHPIVKAMVDRGIGYLAKTPIKGDMTSPPIGVEILTAYTIYKVNGDPDHPVVANGVEAARSYIDTISAARGRYENKAIYILAMSCMLLATVDADRFGPTLAKGRDFYLSIQQPTGGYGYIDGSHSNMSGDLSQTQYVMLAFWTMSQLGIQIPEDRVYQTMQFLMEAQIHEQNSAKFGGWPYQFEPGGNHGIESTNSLSACGLSAILVASDILGVYRNRQADNDEDDLVPSAFHRVVAEAVKKKKGFNVDRARLDESILRGVNFMKRNVYQRATWHYYYLYSKERYESFLEISAGNKSKSPDWYVNEIDGLIKGQSSSGAWGEGGDLDQTLGTQTSTCFAILFLIRSTQKAIGELKDGINRGFDRLPNDLTSVTRAGDNLVSTSETTSIEDALKLMEDDKSMKAIESLVPDQIVISEDPAKRKDQLNRFARLLRSKDYNARRVAAKVLGRSDELDMVPELIYALTDPDKVSARNAENSLRLLSRQLDKYHLPKEGAISDGDRSIAVREWKKWYADIRPDHIFVD